MSKRQRRRARNTGCVYPRKRPDGSLAGYWFKFYQDGEQIVRNANTMDRQEAEDQLAIALGNKAQGERVTRRVLTLGDAVTNIENAAKAEGRDVNYVYEKYLLPYFKPQTPMTGIRTPKIRQYIAERQAAGASNATINRELEALQRAFTLAIEDGMLNGKPHVPFLPEDNVRTGFFERQEFEAVRVALGNECLQDVVTFGYITGWRLHEVLGLRWRNVDFEAGEVRLDVGSTKNGDGRVFPFDVDPEVRQVLERRQKAHQVLTKKQQKKVLTFTTKSDAEALAKRQAEAFVFTRKSGEKVNSFYKRWWTACRAAGIPDRIVERVLLGGQVKKQAHPGRIFHDFRRTAVRNLVNAGVPERVAMQITGHKTRSIFDRYHIVSPEDLREAVRKAARARGN